MCAVCMCVECRGSFPDAGWELACYAASLVHIIFYAVRSEQACRMRHMAWTFQDVCTPVLHATRLFVQRKKHGVQQMNCTVQPINLNQPLTAFREEIHFTVNHEAA